MRGPSEGSGGIRLTDTQKLAWLRLIRSESIGPATFRELLNHFGSAQSALEALPALSERAGRRIRIATAGEAEAEYEATGAAGAVLVALGEPGYPRWLRDVEGAPPLLTVRGSTAILSRPAVAVVGSRNASVSGRKIAMMLANGIGSAGFAIASGLARGIDAAAHEASLSSGTIAVFAGGIDQLYPPEHGRLVDGILDGGGACISEMPFGWEPRARDFPRRNRIVSGLALGVVVVEAADRSGSLITARLAGEQGRLVFAVPGSPLDPRAGGTNRLLRDGATLVTAAEHVVEALSPLAGLAPAVPELREREPDGAPPADADESERSRVIDGLSPTPVAIDEIIRFTGLRPPVVHLVLIELDLAGRLEHHPGGRVSLSG